MSHTASAADRLAEELELYTELGLALLRRELLLARLEGGAGAVQLGCCAHAFEDLGTLGDVVDGQRRDHVAQQGEPGLHRVEILLEGQELAGLHYFLDGHDAAVEVRLAGERVARQEELHARGAHRVEERDRLLLQRVDARRLHAAELPQGHQLAAKAPQIGERPEEGVDAAQAVRRQALFELREGGLGLGGLLRGALANLGELLELVDDELGSLLQRLQRGEEVSGFVVAEPVVGVDEASDAADHVFVGLAGRIFLAGQAPEGERVADAPHQVGVAHLGQVGAVGLGAGGEPGGGGAPHLDRVDARGLGGGAEDGQRAVGKEAVAVAPHGRVGLFADEVVRHDDVLAVVVPVEHVGNVLAVGRGDDPLELHVGDVAVEDLALAAVEVDAAREHDAVPFRKTQAGLADGVDAGDALVACIVHEVSIGLFAEGANLQEDERAHLCIRDVRVVQGLVGIVHRLAVDALPLLGVVLDLDGEIATQGLDEHLVEHRDVGELAGHLVLAAGGGPGEVVGAGRGVVLVAPGVHVRDAALGVDGPAEDLHVLHAGAHLHAAEEAGLGAPELRELGVLHVAKDVLELLHESGVGEEGEGTLGRDLGDVVALCRFSEAVEREDVGDLHLFLEAHEDLEAEEEVPRDADHVAGNAVVLGAGPLVGDEAELGAAEYRLALLVQRLGLGADLRCLLEEAPTNDLVVAALERLLGPGLVRHRITWWACRRSGAAAGAPSGRRRRGS